MVDLAAQIASADPAPSPKREMSSAGSGLLSRFHFMKPAVETQQKDSAVEDDSGQGHNKISSSSTTIPVQTKTRRRRGSLRKVALLGRGAQRDKQHDKPLVIDTTYPAPCSPILNGIEGGLSINRHDALGLYAGRFSQLQPCEPSAGAPLADESLANPDRDIESQTTPDTSTTDEDDILHISHNTTSPRQNLSASSSGSDYFATRGSSPRPGAFQQAKSPLSYSGISTNTISTSDTDWDYAETEWWGWVVLTVTWLVFVIGMGSCLEIWSWAWNVGKTPYAPPELEDDETLPIVGYYPALIILTCVMAWVWVVVAWVGMKYFRHAKISGD